MMRRYSVALFVLLFSGMQLSAERPPVEISALAGYGLGGVRNFDEGRINIDNSFSWNVTVSVTDLPGGFSAEISFSRADSALHFNSDSPDYSDTNFNMASDYILIGANKDFLQDKIRLFLGADIGSAWFDSKDSNIQDSWFFAFDIKGGMKIYFTENMGLRLQGRFLLPLDFFDSGYYLGIGPGYSGGGISFSGDAVIAQGDFSAGLILRF